MAYPLLCNLRMNVSLYQAAATMNANARWQEVIAENLAAGSLPGVRRREISFSAVEAGVTPQSLAQANSRFVIPAPQAHVNLEQGTLRATGLVTDLALEGTGYFEVKLRDGTRACTRDGEFHLNAQGQLVTKQGFEVMGENGPISLDLGNSSSFTVAPTGEVSQGGEVKGRLRIVEFNDPSRLEALGNGFYVANHPGLRPSPNPSSQVRQGYLEGANISPTVEMASMLTAMRMFEAGQRVLQAQDERLGKVITELGNPA